MRCDYDFHESSTHSGALSDSGKLVREALAINPNWPFLFQKTIVFLILVGLGVASVYLFAFNALISGMTILVGVTLACVALFLSKTQKIYVASVHLFLFAFYGSVSVSIGLNGGSTGPAFVWYNAVAILALLIGGPRHGGVWALASLASSLLFTLLERTGVVFSYELPPEVHSLNRLILTTASLVTVIVVGCLYEIERERNAEHQFESTQKLVHLSSRLQSILNSAADGILIFSSAGRVELSNPAAHAILDMSANTLWGQSWESLFDSPRPDKQFIFDAAEARPQSCTNIESRGCRSGGFTFPVEMAISVLPGHTGQQFMVLFRDISARKQAEDLLRASEERYRDLFDNANDLIQSIGDDGRIRYVNNAWRKTLGYTDAEAASMHWEAVVHPDYHAKCRKILVELQNGGEPGQVETVFVKKNGESVFVEGSVNCRFDAGLPVATRGIFRDISERKAAEKLKEEFISTVSHELRTPLTSIRGSLGLILAGATGEVSSGSKELLEIANQSCNRLVRLINDILDSEKLSAGKMDLKRMPCDISTLTTDTVHALASFAQDREVKITLESAPEPAWCMGDPDRFIQIFTNLISNAVKFSPQGGQVHVDVSVRDSNVLLHVKDEGPGIPEAFQAKVFQRFSQADASDQRQEDGTGLGLNISRSLTELMGGRIGFESHPGNGTTFFVSFPRIERAGATQVPCSHSATPEVHYLVFYSNDQTFFEGLHEAAAGRNLVVERIDNPRIALQRAQGPGCSGLIIDVGCGTPAPLDLLRKVKSDPLTRFLPAVVLSSHKDHRGVHSSGGVIWIVDWLKKPVQPERLLAALENLASFTKVNRIRILHVEDDPSIVRLVRELLGQRGDIYAAATLADGRTLLETRKFDLVVLDTCLPDGNGLDLLGDLMQQENAKIPVIVFSALDVPIEIHPRISASLTKSKATEKELVDTILTSVRQAA